MHAADNDFVTVATVATPTEAHLLKNTLATAGLAATIADANMVQTHVWMSNALGGVRVQVPASEAVAAQQVLASLRAGDFALEGDDIAPPKAMVQPLQGPVFSPDAVALWSFVLTPLFGAALHLANARVIAQPGQVRTAWWWLLGLGGASVMALYLSFQVKVEAVAPLRASAYLWLVTMVWYFVAASGQSRFLVSNHGLHYQRKRLFPVAAAAGAATYGGAWLASLWL